MGNIAMPIVFIHGVNTRDGEDYRKDVALRNELINRLILEPLAAKAAYFSQVDIVNPYWGDHGVTFRWNHESVPNNSALEPLGSQIVQPSEMNLELMSMLGEVEDMRNRPPSELELLGTEDMTLLQQAAVGDLQRFLEAILVPDVFSNMNLLGEIGGTIEAQGIAEALLILAGQEVATDPFIRNAVRAARSDNEIIALLKHATQERFEQLVLGSSLTSTKDSLISGQLEWLGVNWLLTSHESISRLFDRISETPIRVAAVPILDLYRQQIHRNLSQFIGDVFIYLNERGDVAGTGPIVSTILDSISTAPRHHPNEPLIIITHSMGGNILYDILTYYDPSLQIDAWISVGGQVGQFEEMKLFKASNKLLGTPDKIKGLKPRVKYWLNIYDPMDVLSFKAAPIFADVDEDLSFITRSGARRSHSAYFERPRFYHMLRDRLERNLI